MKIAFFTSSRADYGKIKPVISEAKNKKIKFTIFVTGSHLLKEYGFTLYQIKKDFDKSSIITFSNQKFGDKQQVVFRNTVNNFTRVLKNKFFNCFFIHGDRIETLAAASVLTFSKIKIAHIEGGELSGTVDEMIRHSVTKLSHIHLVTNLTAKKVLINSGEDKAKIFVTGSPDIDILLKKTRPTIKQVKMRYGINYRNYAISFLHPVTTKTKDEIKKNANIYFDALSILSHINFIQFLPNSDDNSMQILKILKKKLSEKKHIKIFKSMRFEHYLTLLENADFIIGNSSSAIMEAPYFKVPSINVGDRQNNRFGLNKVININFVNKDIVQAIKKVKKLKVHARKIFGAGNSAKKIIKIIKSVNFHNLELQKTYKNLSNIRLSKKY
jgi:UDP-N-acetylglucosamine 2-epimerase (hydrolysing)